MALNILLISWLKNFIFVMILILKNIKYAHNKWLIEEEYFDKSDILWEY